MNKMQDLKKIEYPINLADRSIIKNLINTTESGLYATKSEDGEDVIVAISKGEGMSLKFYQSNGWIREDEYNAEGFKESESFLGRY